MQSKGNRCQNLQIWCKTYGNRCRNPANRGRPALFSPEDLAEATRDGLISPTLSRRGRNEVFYRLRALDVLARSYDPRLAWLADLDAVRAGEVSARRPTILAELGRIEDDRALGDVALQVCDQEPTARTGVTVIRRYRLRPSPGGSPVGLAGVIGGAIADYLGRHSSMSLLEVLEALAIARAEVEEKVRAESPPA